MMSITYDNNKLRANGANQTSEFNFIGHLINWSKQALGPYVFHGGFNPSGLSWFFIGILNQGIPARRLTGNHGNLESTEKSESAENLESTKKMTLRL